MSPYLIVNNGIGLFMAGVVGFSVIKSDVILLMISLEVMLLGVNLVLLGASSIWDDVIGQVFVLFVLTVAAAEAAIGLAILVVFSKVRGGVDLDSIALLHGLQIIFYYASTRFMDLPWSSILGLFSPICSILWFKGYPSTEYCCISKITY